MGESSSRPAPDPAPGPSASDALSALAASPPGPWAELGGRARVLVLRWLRTPAGLLSAVALGAVLAVVGVVASGGGAPGDEGGGVAVSLPLAPGAGGDPADSAGPTGEAGPSPSPTGTAAGVIWVHVAGAVARPGLYGLPASARVADAVGAAGGFAGHADLDRVNLAAPLTDGARLYVPALGQETPPPVPAGAGGGPSGPDGEEGSPGADGGDAPPPGGAALVDLNTATAEELDRLPGVGPTTAAAIIDHRERNGPFASVDQLADVKGIGEAKLEAVRDLVTV
ncbi:MAG: helix-hairpin-helix domain-containing protein [Acidimicrobiales bacterium]|jgi:competence protein ComEA|nr:helix-hairpin-helix domain-containing protein [Acidimicrobiales bacterium]